jgi:hypothetical protein
VLSLSSSLALVDSVKKIGKLVTTVSNMEAYIKQIAQLVEDEKADMKLVLSTIKEWKMKAMTSTRIIELFGNIKEALYDTKEKKGIDQVYNECMRRIEDHSNLCEYRKSIEHIFEGELSENLIKEMEHGQLFKKEVMDYIKEYMVILKQNDISLCLDQIYSILKEKSADTMAI